MKAKRITLLTSLTVTGLIAGYFAPLSPDFPGAAFAGGTKLTPTETYLSVLKTIRADYAPQTPGGKSPDERTLTYAAIDGMLAALHDRYTEFWTPDEYTRNMEETSGVFAGIGATLDTTANGNIVVLQIVDGSPAAKMGVLPGDIVTQVDNHAVTGQTVDAVVEKIKGNAGTTVRLTLRRPNQTAPIQILLTRAMVVSPLVEARMLDKSRIGYVSLSLFGENADSQFASAVARLEKAGMRGLVFDLRDNPGGLLTVAQEIASRFVPGGVVVWIQEKNGKMSPLTVEENKHQGRLYTGKYPVVVLVNGGSASASEIVAGAIKDHHAGTLVGNRTFGKGLVQTIFPLDDDSAVKITTQHYFTPNKTDINKKHDPRTGNVSGGGIAPDVAVDLTDVDWERMQQARRDAPGDPLAAGRHDPQLQKAVTVLQAQLETR